MGVYSIRLSLRKAIRWNGKILMCLDLIMNEDKDELENITTGWLHAALCLNFSTMANALSLMAEKQMLQTMIVSQIK